MSGPVNIDYLADLSPPDVAAWYLRLADFVERKNAKVKNALAPRFLRHYIKGGGKRLVFDPPDHLKNSKYVVGVLARHRSWYLTEKPFKDKWVGIIPRLQQGKVRTSGARLATVMDITSLVEIGVNTSSNTDGDNDLLTSMHGFQLSTMCFVYVTDISGEADKNVRFSSFTAIVTDRYDFDPKKFFFVPNPDYKNPFKVSSPVAEDQNEILVYHRNAQRIEKAGLASPFDLASNGWSIADLAIMGPAEVDPNKVLD